MAKKSVRTVSGFNNELKLKGFNVFQIDADGSATKTYSRKDFYKICLTTGKETKSIMLRGALNKKALFLFFGNPHIPYSWETISTTYVGYTVLFSEDFFKASDRSEKFAKFSSF